MGGDKFRGKVKQWVNLVEVFEMNLFKSINLKCMYGILVCLHPRCAKLDQFFLTAHHSLMDRFRANICKITRKIILTKSFRLVLTSRKGIQTGYQARCIYFWRRMGISILVSTQNVSIESETERLIGQCQEMGPLGGVFHLAMVLRDCLFEDQRPQNFQEAAEAKYWGTKNLDRITQKMCGSELRW